MNFAASHPTRRDLCSRALLVKIKRDREKSNGPFGTNQSRILEIPSLVEFDQLLIVLDQAAGNGHGSKT